MTATYTFDVFSSLDGFGGVTDGSWGGYWASKARVAGPPSTSSCSTAGHSTAASKSSSTRPPFTSEAVQPLPMAVR
jgi:hypothetical protein